MIENINTAILLGFKTQLVNVEASMCGGIPQIQMIGLADQTIRESKERLQIALTQKGIKLGNKKYVVSLNPTDLKKQGGHLDLPIAIAILKASKLFPESNLKIGALGGVNLSGKLMETNEIFSLINTLVEARCDYIFIPKASMYMKRFFSNAPLIGLENIENLIAYLKLSDQVLKLKLNQLISESSSEYVQPKKLVLKDAIETYENDSCENLDFIHVKGQEVAKRAILLAVAGHHHLLMYGPPGTGKTMLASRVPSIQIPLKGKGLYEQLSLLSRTGQPIDISKKILEPFRMPHSGISLSGMVGGMHSHMLGEAALSHRGVLFLDEMPEFKRDVLEGLRGALESGTIFLSKTHYKAEIPSQFTLIATANPCPCGYHGFSNRCDCNERDIRRYFSKLSGPILDRFDLKVEVAFTDETPSADIINDMESLNKQNSRCLSTREMLEAVHKVRIIQENRYKSADIFNGTLNVKEIEKWCLINDQGKSWLETHMLINSGEDSMRFYYKIIKLARTIADLDDSELIDKKHLIEAFYYNRRRIV